MTLRVYSVTIELEVVVVADSERAALRCAREQCDFDEHASEIEKADDLSAATLDRLPDATIGTPRGTEDLTVREWIECAADDTKIHNAVFMSKQINLFERHRRW